MQRQLQFTPLDINTGLVHNQVNCTTRDSQGFLWFGTPSGLSRYDGHHFLNFQHSGADANSLADNYIVDIFNLPDGKLWIKSRSGNDLFDPRTMRFNHQDQDYLVRMGLPAGPINRIQKINEQTYLFVYQTQGLALYKTSKLPGKLPVIHWLPVNNIAAIADAVSDSLGNIWMLLQNGRLVHFNQKEAHWSATQQLPFSEGQKGDQKDALGNISYRLFLDKEEDLWVYTAGVPGNLYCLHHQSGQLQLIGGQKQPGDPNTVLNNNIINAMTQDDDGNIWVGTDHGGINMISKQDYSIRYLMNNQENPKSLAQNCIYCLYKDNNGIIWVGTYKKGVCYYNERMDRFPLYCHDPNTAQQWQSLPYEDVNRFVEDDKGNLWIGTNGGGLIYYDQQNGSFKQFIHDPNVPGSLSANVIVGLCYDIQHRLWIGTYYGGLDCYKDGHFTHYRHQADNPNSLSHDRVWDIYEDHAHQIWVGTLGGGLQRFDEKNHDFISYPPSSPGLAETKFVSIITQRKNGDLWVGTAGGVEIYPTGGGGAHHMAYSGTNRNTISNDNINAIYEDHRGLVWIGTREGLNCFNPANGRIRRFTTQEGLPDNTILTILEDQQHYLWMSTPSGLIRFLPPSSPNGALATDAFFKFEESDGLQGREFNEKSAFKTSSGQLIFGGANGFNLFDPATISIQQQIPPVVFTSLQIGGKAVKIGQKFGKRVILPKSITWTNKLTLPYGASDFSLSFMALGYANSSKISYAYRLLGFNDKWITLNKSSDNSATYTNLDPGDYTLEVKSCNQDGIWNKKSTTMALSILPPFWKTGWAYMFYLLCLAGLLYLARSIILYRAKMRFQLEQQSKQAQYTHEMDIMKIRFFTNISHEFRTPLSLILAPLDKIQKEIQPGSLHDQLDMVRRNAKRLLYLVNQLLDFRKLEVQEIKLQPVEADITAFVEQTASSFTDIAEQKTIDFKVTLPTAPFAMQACFDPGKLERVLFNLLSNAFKFTPEHGQVSLIMDLVQNADLNSNLPQNLTMQADSSDSLSMESLSTNRVVRIRVMDNGIGIPQEQLSRIFERFFQMDNTGQPLNPGSGIGLSITQEFVRLHQGTIQVQSTVGKGSCFTLLLPVLTKDMGAATGMAPTKAQSSATTIPMTTAVHKNDNNAPDPVKHNGRKPTIMLIEDHEDFRFYLKDNLQVHYNILEAVNGKQGLDIIIKNQPDLIVSDIMMQEMDGLQLCKRLKKDPRTMAIPLILLTAKASEAQQLEGLEAGANDYMIKPFNFEILLAKIQNLLGVAKQHKLDSQPKVALQPQPIEGNSMDEQFLKDAQAITETELSNPEFSVEELSKALFVSRVTLYKRLMAISGQSPARFIRSLRVKKAAQYLEKGMNVQEAAYEVGFNDPKIFTKYFKQAFGCLPSEYAKENKNK